MNLLIFTSKKKLTMTRVRPSFYKHSLFSFLVKYPLKIKDEYYKIIERIKCRRGSDEMSDACHNHCIQVQTLSSFPAIYYQYTSEIQNFLKNFIKQPPEPMREDGLRRTFRRQNIIERLSCIAPRVKSNETSCIMCPSESTWLLEDGFVSITFLGMELDLLLHDVLTYNLADFVFGNTPSSILLTYFMHLLRCNVRDHYGKTNMSQKANLSHKFLM